MSRILPDRPSLDHLKQQAKDLLADLERQNPDAKLADAFHGIAREYGFQTWPKLKEHVQSLNAAAHLVGVASPASPFAGRWVADLARSERHPANPFRSATIEVTVDDDAVTMTNVVVDESGNAQQGTQTIQVDGIERRPESGGGYAVVARWRGPRAFETVATKDGEDAGRGRYEVSADGSTLTITAPEQIIVLDRVDVAEPII